MHARSADASKPEHPKEPTMNNVIVTALAFATIAAAPATDVKKDPKLQKQIKQGEHLVKAGLCADCHTPKKMGPRGPEEDETRMLSGHPAEQQMPAAPTLPAGPWAIVTGGDLTSWSGPWGVSFTRNLTPDKETGLGDWTEQNFIDTIRTGKRMGKGRPILPPMPIAGINNYSDEELKAIFAYLQSLPPIKNAVPEPIAPPAPVAVKK
jgi:mono/diheme cytochrome c family protein